jgi:glycosyltransferase involved in cell wall biosynthesis
MGHENRGIGMALKSILENLEDNDNTYLFYMFKKSNPIKSLGINLKIKHYKIVVCPTLKTSIQKPLDFFDAHRLIFHRFRPLREYRPDIFIQFDVALGIPRWKGVRTFIMGYDLIPLIMKGEYLPSPVASLDQTKIISWHTLYYALYYAVFKPKKYYHVLKKILGRIKAAVRATYYLMKSNRCYRLYRKADGVICISKTTKHSFSNLLHVKPEHLFELPLAAVLSDQKVDDRIAKTIKKPYIFYIGGTDIRKRVEEIIYAFDIARGRNNDIALVLAGNEFSKLQTLPNILARNAIERSPYKDDIHLVGFVTDREKLGLYRSAHAFVFTSAYEGFGMPVLEAASMRCPLIAYDNSSISELASNDSAQLIRTGDYIGVALAIERLYNNSLRNNLTEAAKKKANNYSWPKTVKQLLSILIEEH